MTEIKTYRPNPNTTIQALHLTPENTAKALEWANAEGHNLAEMAYSAEYKVRTLKGWVQMPLNSYLVKDTHGEFYPCAPDVFETRWVETQDNQS